MKVRGRLGRLRQTLGGLPPPDQLDLVIAVPVGSVMADDLPPGVHLSADGRVATVVCEASGPDPVVMTGLKERLSPAGLVVTAHP
jgi:hypothetical protein